MLGVLARTCVAEDAQNLKTCSPCSGWQPTLRARRVARWHSGASCCDPYRSNPRATDCGTLAQGRTPVAREPVALLKAVAQVRNASCRVPEVSIHSGSVNPMALALARTALGNRRSRLLGVNRLQGREGREAPLRPDEWLRCNEACDGLPSPQNSVREFWDAPLAPAARHGAVAHAVGRDDRDRCSRDV